MPKRRGRPSAAQTPAPNSDKISGSSKNKVGSATNEGSSKINLSNKTINSLKEKLENFKKDNPSKKNIDLNDLKAVYRRGSGAYSKSHRPTITGGAPNSRAAWSYARVNKFLKKASGEKVKAAYVQDDDLMAKGGLIAPNGNNSNLTPEQYKLVRTPQFKAWFGDWENDPKNASKVVDENGEPMVVYHTTKEEFSKFNLGKKSKVSILKGAYFSNKPLTDWSGFTKEYFLNIKNPLQLDLSKNKRLSTLDVQSFVKERKIIFLSDLSNLTFSEIRDKFDFFDGIIIENVSYSTHTKEYVIHKSVTTNPNQIKLADGTNTTFDAENPDIRYADGGELGQEIVCWGCGWRWNTNQSDASDKYVCHKCWFDNRIYYDSEPIGLADGGYTYPSIPSHLSRVYNSRLKIPNVRGGWTKEKIIKYLKDNSSDTISTFRLTKYISEFDDWEQFKNHIYYHGTHGYIEKGLKPSITMSEREVERIGGGGYGQRYFGVSLTKRKRTAESFSGMSSGVTIYPVILKRDANVIERTDLKDSSEIDDIIVELYEKGIDAVWIGGGEEELVVINPYSILLYTYGKEYHSVYGGFKSIPLTDEEIKKIYNNSKILWAKYSEEYKSKQNQEEKQIFLKSLPNIQFEKGGLIAPNGKPSNLTPEQYKLVRTPQFKAWFGDWENDPENASKVVDENGEPLVVYHGTNSEINEFMPYSIDYYYEYGEPKTEKIFRGDESITEFKNKSKERGWRFIEPNFWFSKNNAYTNTKKQYKCFLKIIHLKKQIDDIVIKRTEKELFIENFGVEIVWSEDTERYYCVFESNQIKLADGTNTTFDAENPDIRYADGGKTPELKVVLIEDGSLLENEAYDIVSNEIGATGMARLGLLENNKLVGAVYIEPPSEYDLNGVHTVEPLYEYKFDIFIKRNKRNKGYSKLLLDSMIKDYVENFDDNCDQIRAEVINEKLRKSLEKNYDFLCDSGNEENITYCYLQREDAKKLYNMKMKDPIKAAKGKKIEAKGDCYYIAGQFAMHKMFAPAQIDFIGEPYIVHAEVKGQGKIEGLRYGHAWIEDDENVYDYSNGRQIKMPKIIYYLIGDIRTDNPKKYMKYTFPEARKKMVDTGTYGSWDIDTLYEEGGGILFKEGGLIAPNGKKSNLTAEQYKLVRTPEFKAWFGDWENDPQNASKVVDQNGEPKVYYQGHPYSEYPQGKNLYEKDNNGIFFSSSKRIALTYGMVKSVFINSRNPKDIRNYYGYDNKKISAANRNDNKYYNKESDEIEYLNSDPNVIKFYEEVIDKYGEVLEIYDYSNDIFQEYKGKKEIKDFLIPTSEKGYKFLNFKFRSSIWDLIAKHIINSEYDGLLATDEDKLREEISDSVVVYNSNQVKIADGTNTTFDGNNPDIRYADGGLIAPNGKPSNLTAEQYKLVRTPEFKAWFGDWENDPQNASKVVDQNGEPKVVFHGTSGDWWKKYFVFNPAYEGQKHTVKRRMAKGIYFTSSINVAKEYIDDTDGHIFSFFLNFRNPILFDMKGQDLNNLDLNSTDYNDDVIIKNTLDTRNNHDLEREQYISDIYLTSKTFGAIKLADGTNTKFDSNNPDVRYSDGGTTIPETDTNMQEVLKETESLKEISIKHGVTMQYLEEQLKIGSDHEKEHFKSEKEVDSEVLQKVAEVIALHHLAERPDYYEKLAELELEDGDIVSEENIPIEIVDFLASQKMEAEQVLMCSDSRLFKTMICRAKIDLSEQRCNDCENPEEKIAWNECKNIWQYCMNDILDNNIPSFKKGGTTCGCGTMYEKGGLAYGNSHDKGGIPLKVSSTGQNIEIEGGEGVVNKRSMQISKKLNFEGQKMTPCEVISKINQMGGGVKFKCSDVENIIAEDGNF